MQWVFFFYHWQNGQWVMVHGLAHTSMRKVATTKEMVFMDGAKLSLEYGLFTPAPEKKNDHHR